MLFNAAKSNHTPPIVRPLEEQEERESQKLWYKTVLAIKESNHAAATEEKSKIEDRQRDETAKRTEQGIEWQPKLFRRVRGGAGSPEEGEEDLDWILNADMYVQKNCIRGYTNVHSDGGTPQEKIKQILAVAPILKGQSTSQQPVASSSQYSQQTPKQMEPSQAQNGEHANLIDFGQHDAPPAHPIPERGSSLQQTTQGPATPSLQQPLIPGEPLKRVDTATNELDEFVDAKP